MFYFCLKELYGTLTQTKTTNKKRKIKLMRCVSVCLDFVVEMGQFVFQFILIHQMDSIYGMFVIRNTQHRNRVSFYFTHLKYTYIEMSFLKSVILQWAV